MLNKFDKQYLLLMNIIQINLLDCFKIAALLMKLSVEYCAVMALLILTSQAFAQSASAEISNTVQKPVTLKMTLLVASAEQRAAWLQVTTQFNKQYPNIHIIANHFENTKYHQYMDNWQQGDSDILYGFAGQRLFEQVASGQVRDISHLWQSENWEESFASDKANLSVGDSVFGLPISFYQWGFYYNKDIFQQLGLAPPTTWQEFLEVCEVIKKSNRYPIIYGLKEDWPAASWFSYFNLRQNGKIFHLDLLSGKASFADDRLNPVFEKWENLINSDYFHPKGFKAKTHQILVYLYRGEAAMTLNGNFITKHMETSYRNDFDFFGFPTINDSQKRYEEAPTDLLFINSNSRHIKEAETFLRFMAKPEVLSLYNDTIGYISPNKHSPESQNHFIRTGARWLQSSDGTTLFLDRDTTKDFADPVFNALASFMRQPDRQKVISELEKARKAVFGKQHEQQ